MAKIKDTRYKRKRTASKRLREAKSGGPQITRQAQRQVQRSEKYELDPESPWFHFASSLSRSVRIKLYDLLALVKLRYSRNVAGNKLCKVDILFSSSEINMFERLFPIQRDNKARKTKRGALKSYPWKLGPFEQRVWKLGQVEEVTNLFSIFKNLKIKLEFVLGFDSKNDSICHEIDAVRYHELLNDKAEITYKQFMQMTFPSGAATIQRCRFVVGEISGRSGFVHLRLLLFILFILVIILQISFLF